MQLVLLARAAYVFATQALHLFAPEILLNLPLRGRKKKKTKKKMKKKKKRVRKYKQENDGNK